MNLSDYTKETGIILHKCAADCMTAIIKERFNEDGYLFYAGENAKLKIIKSYIKTIDSVFKEGVADIFGNFVITKDEMKKHEWGCFSRIDEIVEYIEYCLNYRRFRSGRFGVEYKIPQHGGSFGVVDFWAVHKGTMIIADLKTGDIPVAPYSQKLVDYMIGLQVDRFINEDHDLGEVTISVVQKGEIKSHDAFGYMWTSYETIQKSEAAFINYLTERNIYTGETIPGATPLKSSQKINVRKIEMDLFSSSLADKSGAAAMALLAGGDDLVFVLDGAKTLISELSGWLTQAQDGSEISPCDYVLERWNIAGDAEYRAFVSQMLDRDTPIADAGEVAEVVGAHIQLLKHGRVVAI